MVLSEQQIAFFKQQGYLILENFIAPEQIAAWRGQFWNHVGADPQDPASWPESYVIDGFAVEPAFGQLPQMQEWSRRWVAGSLAAAAGPCWCSGRAWGRRGTGRAKGISTATGPGAGAAVLCWGRPLT